VAVTGVDDRPDVVALAVVAVRVEVSRLTMVLVAADSKIVRVTVTVVPTHAALSGSSLRHKDNISTLKPL
jgi:hypothetical protein